MCLWQGRLAGRQHGGAATIVIAVIAATLPLRVSTAPTPETVCRSASPTIVSEDLSGRFGRRLHFSRGACLVRGWGSNWLDQ